MDERIAISPAAEAHLEAIYEFTFGRGGREQAAVYTDRLIEEFTAIADEKVSYRSIPAEFGIEGFFRACGRHVIYGRRRSDGGISILAILHRRMHQIDRLRALVNDES